MRIGAHVNDDDPVGAATARNADVVQFFLRQTSYAALTWMFTCIRRMSSTLRR